MSDEDRAALLARLKAFTEEACRSPETALAYLVKLGTHMPNGDLAPEYGGPQRSA